ncbi:MAG: IS1 family transposase [Bacteroidetes bacterium]|nr:IS1 family transposase [Bacteroidota bacterium]
MANKSIDTIFTDYYKAYESIIQKSQHIQSKAETYTIEGYNSLFRYFLARMRRKTKCYSKSTEMLEYSIKLLMAKWNGEISILN